MAGPDASRRPKLSLQTKPAITSQVRTRKLASANPRSPTAFNTLSNVYVTAIERSTPVQSTPLTAINTQQCQPLKLQTDLEAFQDHQHRTQSPFTATYPDTPLSANPTSPAQQMDMVFPSQQMTATPPLSAGPTEPSGPKPFSFANSDTKSLTVPQSPAQARRRAIYGAFGSIAKAPYSHNRALHSILRNSPLPPPSARSPVSPRRQSRRLAEKAARRVGYESPLTQTITTEKYVRSHIDLLAEEASPYTPSPAAAAAAEDSEMTLDLAMAYSGDETRDGGQTPGPFEEMRRRMTALGTEAPAALSPRSEGVRKRRKKEKQRKWVWTIGNQEDDSASKDDEEESGAMRAIREAAEASTPRATEPTTPMLRPPVPRRSVKSGSSNSNSSYETNGKGEIPEPIAAVQISVEQRTLGAPTPESESFSSASDAPAAEDRMDVEMSEEDDDATGSSSRATTPPHGVDMDMVMTPTVTKGEVPKLPATLVVDLSAGEERFGLTTTGMGNRRRDTPISPELVTGERL